MDILLPFPTAVTVPEPGGARPLIGHLHLLGGPKPAHITLGNMADKYGPIFMIKMGMHRALIVSNWEIAKECFTSKDKVFCNRPKSLASEILGYNYAMFGLSPYGPYWRQIRKIATLEILSNHRLEMLKHIRESEVKASVKEIYDLWMKNKKNKGTTKEESKENERSKEALRKFFELTGAFPLADALPFMRWLDLGGHEKAMKKTAKELDEVVEEGAQELPSYDADTINKATCLAMILGGTDTTTVTLTWAVALLLNNRHVLEKAQNELDTQNAPFVVNLSKLHRDPKVWCNPCEFQPERFLTTHKDCDVRGQNFELLPFGSGRRVCPGISFALQVMQLTLAHLLQGFEFATPGNEPIDMVEGIGLTNLKATPLEVLLTPRLPAHIYQ
ncbi:hypothetical protein Patl1_09063 [Pistacia atlantica]|uniref:Uncharacterized protein n=1 Tax=Pistacia atlantica TaxID=434234 RepID=A0ACC1AHB3_9ROSI|nr:hypothetical protein Patl1_09063 [Pistacia atlantica]